MHLIATATAYDFKPKYLSFLEGWGESGVDIFFVLSGFIILHTQLQNKRSLWKFLKLRMIRIVPIYWLVSLILVACYLIFPPSVFNSETPSIEWIFQSLFFISSMNSSVTAPIVGVGWTLELEMLFYCLFAFSLFFNNWSKSYIFLFLSLLLIILCTSKFILFEFLFGMLVAIAFNKIKLHHKYGLTIFIFGFLFLLASINLNDQVYMNRVIIWGVPSSIIIFGLIYAKQYNNILFKSLGDASYSIYLIHAFTISAFYKLISLINISINNDYIAFVCLFFTILFGAATYSYIEKPLTSFIRSKLT